MVKSDPRRVLDFIAGENNPRELRGFAQEAAEAWITQSPAEALHWLQGQPNESLRDSASHSMFYQVVRSDAGVASQVFEYLREDSKESAIRFLISNWAEKDPLLAKEFLGKIENPAILKNGVEAIMRPWAKSNPGEAFSFFEKHQELFGIQKDLVVREIASGWALKDRAQALEWAATFEDPKLTGSVIGTINAVWSQHDPAAAAEAGVLTHAGDWILRDAAAAQSWIKSLEPHKQILAIRETLGDLASTRPSYGAELYEQMRSWPGDPGRPDGNFTDATGRIAAAWARRDPEAAGAWLLSLEAGPASDNALSQGARRLEKYAPALTAQLFAKITSQEYRDRTASEIVNQNFSQHPQIAFEWSQQIEDDSLRQAKTGDVLRRLQEQGDFEGARELVDRANLSEAQKTEFLQRIQNGENVSPVGAKGAIRGDLEVLSR
jgi:hypothetical protein